MRDIESVLVSVIIPVYNVGPWLRQCVDSVLSQTHKDLEIILVDDGSTDGSGEICDEYRSADYRIKVRHQENAGLSEARNKGLDMASGEYVYFLDSDDWIRADAIEILLENAEQTGCELILFDAKTVNEAGDEIEDSRYARKTEYPILSGKEMFCQMRQNGEYYSSACLIFIKRDLPARRNISFFSSILHEDELFTFLLLMNAEKTVHINDALYFRRVRPGSIMSSPGSLKNVKGLYCVARGIKDYYDTVEKSHLRDVIYEHICFFADRCLLAFDSIDVCTEKAYSMLSEICDFGIKLGLLDMSAFCALEKYDRVVCYGAGVRCGFMLRRCCAFGPDEIWDRNAEKIMRVDGISVVTPNFESLRTHESRLLVVCADGPRVWTDVSKRCAAVGFRNVCNWQSYYAFQKLSEASSAKK
jgi:glycosyltransferase involved in cell wall biosynthesis